MSIADLGARRASISHDAAVIRPRDLLSRMIEDIDRGEIAPTHIMIVSATTDPSDKSTSSQIDHAGPYDRFGQVGMLACAIAMIQPT